MISESLLNQLKKHKIIIAIAALAQTWLSYQLFNIPINPYLLLFVTIATPFSYNLAESFSYALNQENKSFLTFKKLFFGITFFILLYIASFLNKNTIAQFAMAAIIAIAYNFPLKSNKNSAFRLRQIKGLKIFLIAFSWTLVTVYIPINLYIVNKISLAIVLINNFLFIAILSLLFDIKDFKKDKLNNLPSIPVLIGVTKSYHIIQLILALLIINTYFLYDDVGFATTAALLLHILFSYVVIFKLKSSHNNFYYTILIDGLLISQALVVWIAKNL
jgi:4-hydroxybenzoate polyprenyltransferase